VRTARSPVDIGLHLRQGIGAPRMRGVKTRQREAHQSGSGRAVLPSRHRESNGCKGQRPGRLMEDASRIGGVVVRAITFPGSHWRVALQDATRCLDFPDPGLCSHGGGHVCRRVRPDEVSCLARHCIDGFAILHEVVCPWRRHRNIRAALAPDRSAARCARCGSLVVEAEQLATVYRIARTGDWLRNAQEQIAFEQQQGRIWTRCCPAT